METSLPAQGKEHMGAYKVSHTDSDRGPASEPGAYDEEEEAQEQETQTEKKLQNGFL